MELGASVSSYKEDLRISAGLLGTVIIPPYSSTPSFLSSSRLTFRGQWCPWGQALATCSESLRNFSQCEGLLESEWRRCCEPHSGFWWCHLTCIFCSVSGRGSRLLGPPTLMLSMAAMHGLAGLGGVLRSLAGWEQWIGASAVCVETQARPSTRRQASTEKGWVTSSPAPWSGPWHLPCLPRYRAGEAQRTHEG